MATRNVAMACRQVGATLIYISTDFIFDGKKGSPYDEFDVPHPINVYGRTKLAGEYYATQIAPRTLIVRTAWLFGYHGRNFVKAILQQAQNGEQLRVVEDQIGSPTFAPHLARKILQLAETSAVGIYKFGFLLLVRVRAQHSRSGWPRGADGTYLLVCPPAAGRTPVVFCPEQLDPEAGRLRASSGLERSVERVLCRSPCDVALVK